MHNRPAMGNCEVCGNKYPTHLLIHACSSDTPEKVVRICGACYAILANAGRAAVREQIMNQIMMDTELLERETKRLEMELKRPVPPEAIGRAVGMATLAMEKQVQQSIDIFLRHARRPNQFDFPESIRRRVEQNQK